MSLNTPRPIRATPTSTAAMPAPSDLARLSSNRSHPARFTAVAAAASAAVALLLGSLATTPAVAQPQLMPAIATTASTADGEMPRHGGKGHGGPGAAGGAHGMGMMGLPPLHGRMLDRVGATDEQKAQIEQIMQAARADLKAQRDAAAPAREQARSLFAQPNVDARTAETLRQQLMTQQDQASRRMMQAMIEASRVLSVEQRQALVQQAEQRRELMQQRRAEPMQRHQRGEHMQRHQQGERRPMSGAAGGTI
jgi:periplasmic protein CpxP/Spy